MRIYSVSIDNIVRVADAKTFKMFVQDRVNPHEMLQFKKFVHTVVSFPADAIKKLWKEAHLPSEQEFFNKLQHSKALRKIVERDSELFMEILRIYKSLKESDDD